ncbi:phosphatase PAP2 family protein [Bradyrhizobium sp. CB82]|uniref:phosphatase PAP2 family protein n=1 Tax=Bradyrhizobium sp. CB82 TaxID=3039159 RepID=UPI0024B24340|nr:phosphatase PAP2 family protein [Bradyrhizobium sp. CB82]WFU38488.1 phosphatase PAP2 family protein [Bradyrhizobium sp. CB82]
MIMMMLVLPLAGRYRRGAEAIYAYVFALAATTCISALVPAIGAYQALGSHADYPHFEPQGYYDTLRDASLVRAGLHHKVHLTQLVGVLTFPSFHTAAAILYMWAFWPLRWFSLVVIPWNMVMIVATVLGRGHYLSDIIAGAAVAASAIAITARIGAACSPVRRDMPTGALSHRDIA